MFASVFVLSGCGTLVAATAAPLHAISPRGSPARALGAGDLRPGLAPEGDSLARALGNWQVEELACPCSPVYLYCSGITATTFSSKVRVYFAFARCEINCLRVS